MKSMLNNKNAEKWTLEEATVFFDEAIDLSKDDEKKFDFIGEVAREMGTYRAIFIYLSDKFIELKSKHETLLTNLEANCFLHGKKGDIVPSLAIMNLKSNHKWTDRIDNTTKGDSIINKPDYSNLSNEEIIQLKKLQEKTK